MTKLEFDGWLQIVASVGADSCHGSHQSRSHLEQQGAPQCRAIPWQILSVCLPEPTLKKETLPYALKLSHLGSLNPDIPWRGEKVHTLCFLLTPGAMTVPPPWLPDPLSRWRWLPRGAVMFLTVPWGDTSPLRHLQGAGVPPRELSLHPEYSFFQV